MWIRTTHEIVFIDVEQSIQGFPRPIIMDKKIDPEIAECLNEYYKSKINSKPTKNRWNELDRVRFL